MKQRCFNLHFIFFPFVLFFALNTTAQQNKKEIVFSFLNAHENFEQLKLVIPLMNDNNISINNIPSIFPLKDVKEFVITSAFGIRNHPIEKRKKRHNGIDIACELGTFVIATADGVIIKAQRSSFGYGNAIEIKHQYGYTSKYAHLAMLLVRKNQVVKKGDIIGMVGSTGKSTGNHLHFEIIKNNRAVDPADYFFIDRNFK